ncbi:hypothetical protein TNIN_333781 [Trichonephila inaurata madagascariensis]|uniref:Uncharacterized protein n=1 Tax=Trichonephila inaurata madagascariensis TaxID=2747483 RepID=A0A8X6YIC6_9ARAC|nr:hypothetical protein TNIN_333781 [Trichonephila inaurata madagascariensis]
MDSLTSCWCGPNNRSLWSLLNAIASDDPSEHLDYLSTTPPLFLQSPSLVVLQGASLLSQKGPVNCHKVGHFYICYDSQIYGCCGPKAEQ